MALSKSTTRAIDTARLHLKTGNPGAYARSLAGEHRAQSERQQRAIEAVIAADATGHLFSGTSSSDNPRSRNLDTTSARFTVPMTLRVRTSTT
jgi:hypothetical protein